MAKSMFVNIVERYIEASHAIVKRQGGTYTSGAVVSLARRLPQIEDRLRCNPSFLSLLLEHFKIARHVSKLPEELGVAGHPVFRTCSPHEMQTWEVVKHLRKIIYRADIEGQFIDVTDAAKHHKTQGRLQIKKDEACIKDAYGEIDAAVSEDGVWKRMFFATLAACCCWLRSKSLFHWQIWST